MFITWMGLSALKIEYKTNGESAVLLLDAYAPKGETMPKSLAAQVAILTRGEEGTITFQKDPYVIQKPGEYETAGISVFGFANTGSAITPTIYKFAVEGVTFAHLGLTETIATDALVAELEGVDVLFVPCGGKTNLTAEQAGKLVTQIEPRVVIPIGFSSGKSGKDLDPVTKFLKEIGAGSPKAEDRVRLRKQDLPTDTMDTILLSA